MPQVVKVHQEFGSSSRHVIKDITLDPTAGTERVDDVLVGFASVEHLFPSSMGTLQPQEFSGCKLHQTRNTVGPPTCTVSKDGPPNPFNPSIEMLNLILWRCLGLCNV